MNEKSVVYEFEKPVCSYFTCDGVLVRTTIETDAKSVMEKFREKLNEADKKKKN